MESKMEKEFKEGFETVPIEAHQSPSESRVWKKKEFKTLSEKIENNDYEEINGELYIRATSLVKAILESPNFEGDEKEFLEQDLGLDKEGNRI